MTFFKKEIVIFLLPLAEDGSVKYKVRFANKSRSLVSGRHMAFEWRPRLSQLRVGTRVVMERPDAAPRYSTGILAELPSWKNRMRFVPEAETQKDADCVCLKVSRRHDATCASNFQVPGFS